MKKIVLVVAALALLVAGVNAADLQGDAPVLKATVTGSASVTWGMNLNAYTNASKQYATGFSNASSASVTIDVLPARTHTEKGEGDIYATISLTDVKASLASANTANVSAGSVSAKVFVGPAYINILGISQVVDKAAKVTSVLDLDMNKKTDLEPEYNGIEIGLVETKPVSVSIGVTSKKDWLKADDTTSKDIIWVAKDAKYDIGKIDVTNVAVTTLGAAAIVADGDKMKVTTAGFALVTTVGGGNGWNTENQYDYYVAVGLTAVENLTLNAVAVVASNMSQVNPGFGINAAYVVSLGDLGSVTPSLGVDITGTTVAGSNSDIEVAGKIATILTKLVDVNVAGNYYLNLGTGTGTAWATRYDAALKAVENLNLGGYLEVTAKSTEAFFNRAWGVNVDYTIDMIKPYAKFTQLDKDTRAFVGDDDNKNVIQVGVEVKPISLLTLTLDWTSNNIAKAAGSDDLAGIVTATAKISF